jgi:hypothetical protein
VTEGNERSGAAKPEDERRAIRWWDREGLRPDLSVKAAGKLPKTEAAPHLQHYHLTPQLSGSGLNELLGCQLESTTQPSQVASDGGPMPCGRGFHVRISWHPCQGAPLRVGRYEGFAPAGRREL